MLPLDLAPRLLAVSRKQQAASPVTSERVELQANALLLARPVRSRHRSRHHLLLHHPPHLASQRGRAGSSALRRSVGAWLLLPTR